jgi:tRNA A-37 threonylcarbamoyl transferase component Bud32
MRLQLASPSEHSVIRDLPFEERLDDWSDPRMHRVLGLHRHVVRLIEFPEVSYVIKELPDHLVEREYRLLRRLAEEGLPTAEVVAAVTGKGSGVDGMLVTRHLDYSLPYRVLLSGRGLDIPYLGERVLDSLVSLLVRLHLEGFFWGDCSLSNTLFRRDAGALSAYIIDTETAEWHDELTPGQRSLDLSIATENVAGGLLDLQMGGQLRVDIDPWDVSLQVEHRYHALWDELTAPADVSAEATYEIEHRLRRLHDLGFDVEEMEIVEAPDGNTELIRVVPRVVEHGYHAHRLKNLTGLETTENQARRLLDDIHAFAGRLRGERAQQAEQAGRPPRPLPDNVAAVRWLDDRFEPIMDRIPIELFSKLEPVEIFHQLLEHRWFKSEETGTEVKIVELIDDYIADVLVTAPDEFLRLDDDLSTE